MENNQIYFINNFIDSSDVEVYSSGVSYGLGGVSLFKYYLYLLTQEEKYLQDSISYLDDAMNLISSKNYSPIPNFSKELLEIATLIHYYVDEQVLDIESVESFLDIIDPIIDSEYAKILEIETLSPQSGLVSFGMYYLQNQKYVHVNEIIEKIMKKAIAHEDGLVWQSDVERDGKYLHELGIFHGSAGIISFLLECLKDEKFTTKIDIKNIIDKGLKSIIYLEKTGEHNFFPSQIEDTKYPIKSNLVYGDIGIATILYKSGKILQNDSLKAKAKKVLERCLKDTNKITKDEASLIFGTSGIYSIIGLIEAEEEFDLEVDKKEILELLQEEEKNNFSPQLNRFIPSSSLSFSSGVSGVGIAMIAAKIKNYDFLNFLNYKL
ncbi:lanthionine synthetase LanC family protein [Chryseobacterium sp. SIMBA_028]|uniref:lanthionine synthetase LanC family protein n=2 Tax=Bacteria TaxID=2 RepID=UPI00397E5DC7